MKNFKPFILGFVLALISMFLVTNEYLVSGLNMGSFLMGLLAVTIANTIYYGVVDSDVKDQIVKDFEEEYKNEKKTN